MSADRDMVWRWDLTADEVLAGFAVRPDERVRSPQLRDHELVPFAGVPLVPLEGTPYEYQLAIGADAKCPDMQAIAQVQPEFVIPDETRSGLLVFDGDQVVGWLLTLNRSNGYLLRVDQRYHRTGVATAILAEWGYRTMRPRVLRSQSITQAGADAQIKAHAVIMQRAARRVTS